ncbi:MAG: hypothetical protein US62_C0018G0020 [Candidatus Woesebacteria bacterium GW2011_GWA1_37_8]|uniref:Membrane-bound metal-dependent hydrolase n=2 Tax=Candidatus Woeseibacteriota TaxID=1752722 RepID=A0A0G0NLK3_9BACT|nr:MAG: hypothetical protein US62_C0018G0020 [Candidatus Woesebacteria bacterium GW2011_GWA1_37_8]KKQ86779.1 MAG: hypothetical protein UT10_C0017G0021 [Candidatus Woesebacteria bacterium GW2011_GWB1_38_8b]
MKRDLVLHFIYLVPFFALIVVLKSWFKIPMIVEFAIGGLLGTFLPFLDYIIYAFVLKPQVPVVTGALNKKSILGAISQYENDKTIAGDLIFHTALFQAILLVFVFFVVSSSGSLLARGMVLSFALHLILDQVQQYSETKSFDSWFIKFPLALEPLQKKIFVVGNAVLLLVFGLLF